LILLQCKSLTLTHLYLWYYCNRDLEQKQYPQRAESLRSVDGWMFPCWPINARENHLNGKNDFHQRDIGKDLHISALTVQNIMT